MDDEDVDGIDELEDEWQIGGDDKVKVTEGFDPAMLRDELAELRRYADLADSIRNNAKGEALIPAMKIAFEQAVSLGAKRKAVIFTESRRTQEYLFELLSQVAGVGGAAAFSGDGYLQVASFDDGRYKEIGKLRLVDNIA